MAAAGRDRRRTGPRPRILFAAAEVYPLIQTGGLADVAGNLPPALKALGYDVRLLVPAYRRVLNGAGDAVVRAEPRIGETGETVRLLEAALPGHGLPVYLIDAPDRYDRPGNPYVDASGADWPDNAARFGLLGRVIDRIGRGQAGLDWRPDLVHCNDWHTGLGPALLSRSAPRPATVFTIHNLLFQGNFPPEAFDALGLPGVLRSPDALEFHGHLSFIKGGLACADRLVAVSPTYAREITTPEYGCGLDGLLRHRGAALTGILNGVDYAAWDPRRDLYIPQQYWVDDLDRKGEDKAALQKTLGLEIDAGAAVLACISRLSRQKGIDLILAVLDEVLADDRVQVVVLGAGEAKFESSLRSAAADRPGRMAVRIDFDEALAHLIQAGADMLLMPSRFEPCGLTQLYALRYGTVPVARATGGLADTIVDAARGDAATGFLFRGAEPRALLQALRRALALFAGDAPAWRRLMRNGMHCDFGWGESARRYAGLYQELLAARGREAGAN